MKILVMADTHIRAGRTRHLPHSVYELLEGVDAVLHAGDVVEAPLLHELAGFAPTHAVLGNNDTGELAGLLPETLEREFDGVRIAMIHDSGPTKGRPARLNARFPGADLVVYGHSHIPFDGAGVDGQRLLNPGSPTERRTQPHHTVGLVTTDAGRFTTEIRVVD